MQTSALVQVDLLERMQGEAVALDSLVVGHLQVDAWCACEARAEGRRRSSRDRFGQTCPDRFVESVARPLRAECYLGQQRLINVTQPPLECCGGKNSQQAMTSR
jgi:hypothetical protein